MRTFREFLRLESSAGIILFCAAVIALIVDNTSLSQWYHQWLNATLSIPFGPWHLAKPVILWVNEGLMTIFFLLVGLEIKRELFEGELKGWSKAMLPGVAAVGGMVLPALVFVAFNWHDGTAMRGWAIPTATDIAFSLGILALLGSRVAPSLKIFLTALAIFDDIGGIVIIAIFYTKQISLTLLGLALVLCVGLFILNRCRVMRKWPYILVAFAIWLCVLKSGVHATLTGIVLAFAIPLRDDKRQDHSPVRDLEHSLHPWVAFLILPVFAFANAGVSFAGLGLQQLFSPISMGIMGGLFIGKQLGVWGAVALAVKLGWAKLPHGATWRGIYAIGLIAGVGFTLSLFIGGLAFATLPPVYMVDVKIGVLAGSALSGIVGYLLFRVGPSPAPLLLEKAENKKKPNNK